MTLDDLHQQLWHIVRKHNGVSIVEWEWEETDDKYLDSQYRDKYPHRILSEMVELVDGYSWDICKQSYPWIKICKDRLMQLDVDETFNPLCKCSWNKHPLYCECK